MANIEVQIQTNCNLVVADNYQDKKQEQYHFVLEVVLVKEIPISVTHHIHQFITESNR